MLDKVHFTDSTLLDAGKDLYILIVVEKELEGDKEEEHDDESTSNHATRSSTMPVWWTNSYESATPT